METDKYIEVAYGSFVTAKQTGEVKKKITEIMENPSLLRYTTCYFHQTCAIDYFPLLR